LGKKGGSRRLKRKPAPKIWPIHRKEHVWITKPKPGPHGLYECLPLALLLRDILGLAKTRKEAKLIISQGKVLVDGKIRKEELFPIGLMDVIDIPEIVASYRILPSAKGFTPHQLKNKEEATFKLYRIEGKTILKNGYGQIHLHDGKNILLKNTDAESKGKYEKFDVLKINLSDKSIMAHIKMTEGSYAIIIGGKNRGKHGTITEIEKQPNKKQENLLVTLKDKAGNTFQTTMNFVFPIGDASPSISLPEGS